MDALPRRALSLFDATCLIVGIIVGAGVYQVAPDVARGAGSAAGALALWAAGALLSLCGALGYAELASAFRDREGGDVVYLGRAYGPWAGFLFGWTQLAVVRPGDIAVMAFAFATYARALLEPLAAGGSPGPGLLPYAAGAVAVLTALNVAGVTEAKWAQNLLTVAKVIGLVAIAGLALATPRAAPAAADVEPLPWTVALILVLFSYGGWNEMAYVAAEVKHPRRSIVRALLLGMAAVAALYLLLNGALLHALGVGGVAASSAVASDAVSIRLPGTGSRLVAALIAVSALGAVNGLIFTGARISYAAG
ncbi:MAG: amino acid transporter, partial [Acidobacteria bacterium]|nr:amino acid transporter [Acidobacteriota bacterium]